ncbi:MAG: hypothetical protein K2W95_15100 [Candidatus Obscuribacterales bacterium]|nr:hypothetical protein [Candidatus Obscuribacterales bacterium]
MVSFFFLVKQAIWLFVLVQVSRHCLAKGRDKRVPELKRCGYGLGVLSAIASAAMAVLMLWTLFLGVSCLKT